MICLVKFQIINQGLIYALRYELCDDLARSPDLTDSDPRRTMWNFLSPIALFASAKAAGGKSNELVPVAIQMDYKPGLVILRPLSTLENDLVISRINFIFTKY